MIEESQVSPFNDIKKLISQSPPLPSGVAGERDLVAWLGAWQGRQQPVVERPLVAIYASSFGAVATPELVEKAQTEFAELESGKSELGQLAGELGAGLRAFDLALAMPSKDVRLEPSFSESECAANIAFGMEVIAAEPDLIILGEAGVGSEFAAALIGSLLFDEPLDTWAFGKLPEGPSSDVEEQDPLSLLARYGSREIAAHLGALIAARHMGLPVFLDGPSAAVAALLLERLSSGAADHSWLTDPGSGPGSERLLAHHLRRPVFAMEDTPSGGLLSLGLLRAR